MGFWGSIYGEVKRAYADSEKQSEKPSKSGVNKYMSMFDSRKIARHNKVKVAKENTSKYKHETATKKAAIKQELARRSAGRNLSQAQLDKLEKVIARQLDEEITRRTQKSISEDNKILSKRIGKYTGVTFNGKIYAYGGSYATKPEAERHANYLKDNHGYLVRVVKYIYKGAPIWAFYYYAEEDEQERKRTAVRASQAKASKQAVVKAFNKTAVFNNKRYTLASVFYQSGDRAKAYASNLKSQGFSARVKTITTNGITNYAVYSKNPSKKRKATGIIKKKR